MPKRKAKSEADNRSQNLRFSTGVLRLLGEGLNPSPDQGILELIKNAYDADASKCTVELKGVHVIGGSIRLCDDGRGMTLQEIQNGWLVVGDSSKERTQKSPKGRLLVGSKGLGRLAALRLGRQVSMVTRPLSNGNVQYRVEIDWDAFERASVVEDVAIAITEERAPIGARPGTEIQISDLPTPWREAEIRRLARSILLLRDPFAKDTSFHATLKAEAFDQIEQLARAGYFSECDFHLKASVDEDGRASAEVRSAGGRKLFSAKHNEISTAKGHPIYGIPSLTFELWEFNLSSKGFAVSTKHTTLGALREWLAEFGGIRLYHRGVRIPPYGEPKNDWLDLNLRRSQHQELRPSTNNSLGRISIEDPKLIYQQKTDRQGFVDSTAFDELRKFTDDVLDWMAGERRKDRDSRKKAASEQVKREKSDAQIQLSSALDKLSDTNRKVIEPAIKKLQAAHEAEVEIKDETTQLYFTLGTVGTTAAAFAHQTKVPIKGILTDANMLEEYLGDPDTLALFREESSKTVKRIHTEAQAIYSFSNVTLRLLEHEKRRSSRHSVHKLIEETIELLQPYFDARGATIQRAYAESDPVIWCARAAFEAILTNILTNSLQAFERKAKAEEKTPDRTIHIQTTTGSGMVTIRIQDNGPGIDKLALDEIWLPGKTTTERGTGLGLAIVKDVVEELRGRVSAEAKGELGGAVFTISLPMKV